LKLRLAEIDALEFGQPFGRSAKQELSDLIYMRDVEVELVNVAQYGRSVALVSRNGMSVNREMLVRGMAWCFTRYSRHE